MYQRLSRSTIAVNSFRMDPPAVPIVRCPGAAPRRARRPGVSRASPELVAPGAVPQRSAPRSLVVVRHPQELERGGAAEARLERPPLDDAIRDVTRPDPERCRLHALLRPVVQRGDEAARAALEANHDEGHVPDPDGDPDARLDEVALRVGPQVPAQVKENPRVRDLYVVIEPVAVHV